MAADLFVRGNNTEGFGMWVAPGACRSALAVISYRLWNKT